jgi:hypothetical protein
MKLLDASFKMRTSHGPPASSTLCGAWLCSRRSTHGPGFLAGSTEKRYARFEATGNSNMTADGDWDLVVTTPLGERRGVLSLKTDGKVLLGHQTADGNSTEIFDGVADGTVLSWKISITDPMPMILKFSGSIDGNRLGGTVALGEFGDFSFSGTRVAS